MERKVELVGICGPICSGKTTLSKELVKRLDPLAGSLSFDDFQVKSAEWRRETTTGDWSNPTLYRYDEFAKALKQLKKGSTIRYEATSRESKDQNNELQTLTPNSLIFVEGFMIYHYSEIRSLFDKRLYLDITEEEMVRRRLERAALLGGDYTAEHIRWLLSGTKKFLEPQKSHAELILDGSEPITTLTNKVISFLGLGVNSLFRNPYFTF